MERVLSRQLVAFYLQSGRGESQSESESESSVLWSQLNWRSLASRMQLCAQIFGPLRLPLLDLALTGAEQPSASSADASRDREVAHPNLLAADYLWNLTEQVEERDWEEVESETEADRSESAKKLAVFGAKRFGRLMVGGAAFGAK